MPNWAENGLFLFQGRPFLLLWSDLLLTLLRFHTFLLDVVWRLPRGHQGDVPLFATLLGE